MVKVSSEMEYQIIKEFLWRLEAVTNDAAEIENISFLLKSAIGHVNDNAGHQNSLHWIGDVGN
jgi:hypothetical protein